MQWWALEGMRAEYVKAGHTLKKKVLITATVSCAHRRRWRANAAYVAAYSLACDETQWVERGKCGLNMALSLFVTRLRLLVHLAGQRRTVESRAQRKPCGSVLLRKFVLLIHFAEIRRVRYKPTSNVSNNGSRPLITSND